ncbi:transposase, partial [Streptococcus suis]
AFRNKPLTETDKVINRHISKVRCRVEHVFGFIKMSMKGSICRFEQIKRLGLPLWA